MIWRTTFSCFQKIYNFSSVFAFSAFGALFSRDCVCNVSCESDRFKVKFYEFQATGKKKVSSRLQLQRHRLCQHQWAMQPISLSTIRYKTIKLNIATFATVPPPSRALPWQNMIRISHGIDVSLCVCVCVCVCVGVSATASHVSAFWLK